jgi:GH35 family endo-1,4-beta-xylanase
VLIGAASNAKFWDTSSYEIVNREFAYVTPGNDFKQTAIHPQPGKWKWKTADEWIERCKKNSQVMRLHSAISPQCSKWAKSDNRTPAELKQNLQEYMTEVCKRYNDQPHVRWMDVVNETVSRNGEWFGPREGNDRWENPWYQIGVDERHPLKPPVYIKMAFELANQHAPNIKQIVNQHGGMESAMWDKVKGIVEHLQDSGIRVDGIGWQGHIDTGFENDPNNMKALKSLIEWAQSRKLEFHVTEFNAWIRTEEGETISKDDLAAQAKTYLAVLEVLRDYGDTGVVTWCAWQIKDNETERGHLQGNLYDAEGQPKPALKAVKRFSQKSVAQKSANQN